VHLDQLVADALAARVLLAELSEIGEQGAGTGTVVGRARGPVGIAGELGVGSVGSDSRVLTRR
jgi:hypothetical protein